MNILIPYLIHAVMLLATLGLGLFGLWLGNLPPSKVRTVGVLSLLIGVFAALLLLTPYAVASLGVGLVFLLPFCFAPLITKAVTYHRPVVRRNPPAS